MASFRPHPGGRVRVQIFKRGIRDSAIFSTKTEARAWATRREAEIESERRGELPRKTVIDALRRYAAEVCPTHKGERWEVLRLTSFERTLPFAEKLLAGVTPSDIASWRDERGRFVSTATVRREWNLLHQVITIAINEWGWLRADPMKGVRRPKEAAERTRRILPLEVRAICRQLGWKSRVPETKSQETALAFLISLRTGMRSGEILGVRPGDVDMERRVCRLYDTKNGDDRPVPLTKSGARLLGLLQARGGAFSVDDSSRDALFRRAVAACGIEDLHFHDARAEALTRLSRKVDVMRLAKISGHRDPRILLNRYYRESAEDIARALG